MFYQKDYEKFEDRLNCCPEILAAIENVSGKKFELEDKIDCVGHYAGKQIVENSAYTLWRDGGQEDEILSALPTDHNPEDEAEIYWGGEVFAEFDENAGKWIKK